MSDVDAANYSVTFTVPPSGRVGVGFNAEGELEVVELPDDQLVPDNTDPLPDEEPIRTDPVEPEEE